MEPSLRFRPLRPAVAIDGATTLELLISIAAPEAAAADQNKPRPPLNLALVIDRSGSMSGNKLSQARKAARFLVGELSSRDRLAIVTFDDEVSVLVPSQPVVNTREFNSAINHIHSGGSTALFDGWLAGGTQVAEHLDPAALNRVLLLSDGQANQGLTNQDAIADKVKGLSRRGISTSAFGLGADFDEDLMGAIASAGDGTLAHIESPDQLADLYASELQGLNSTVGRRLSLVIETCHGAQLLDVLNDLPRNPQGEYQLPNLRQGQELSVGLKLQLPAWLPNQEILRVRLAWEAPGNQQRQSLSSGLSLQVCPAAELAGLANDAAVEEELTMLQANRARRQALEELDRGDFLAAEGTLGAMYTRLSCLASSEDSIEEMSLLKAKMEMLRTNHSRARKALSGESLRSSLNVWLGKGKEK